MMFNILKIDKNFIVVNKPSGILVHKSGIDKRENIFMLQELRDQLGKKVYPVHRLDKPTSGVIIFAFNKEYARYFHTQFSENLIEKSYLALVRGYISDNIHIDHPIQDKKVFRNQNREKIPFKSALTDIRPLQNIELPIPNGKYQTSRYSFLQIFPQTGRYHQIRRHLKHISHPIIGDTAYGKTEHNNIFRKHFNNNRLLLHARSITFINPENNKKEKYICHLPENFKNILQAIGIFPDKLNFS